jgi:hypothetical protein
MSGGGVQGEFIAVRAESKQAAACDVTEIALVAKIFSGKGIAQVDLYEGNLNREQGIPQCDAGVRKTAWIQNDEIDLIGSGPLNSVNQFMFGIALKAFELMPQLLCELDAALLDVGEGGCAIDTGFAGTQEVQIRTID